MVASGLVAPLLIASVAGAEIDPRVAAALAQKPLQTVIVELADPQPELPLAFQARPAERQRARTAREAVLGAGKDRVLSRLAASRHRVVSRWPSFKLMAIETDAAGVTALARDPDVARVHFNRTAKPNGTTSFGFTGATAFHARGDQGWGATVAVIDSAVRFDNGYFGTCPKPGAPGCSVLARMNFSPDPIEDVASGEPHGTNVAGIVLGMAPKAKVVSLNVFHYEDMVKSYVSSLREELDALHWLAANADYYQVVAANMSLGADENRARPCNTDPLYDAFRVLWESHGILVAVAAGNEGYANGTGSPACISLGVTVGAQYDVRGGSGSCIGRFSHAGDLACFSNRNGMLDLVAPGVDIDAGGLAGYTGTSMSAPHVAGAIALLQAAHKARAGAWWPPDELHRKLVMDAVPRWFGGWAFSQLRVDPDARAWDTVPIVRWPRENAQNLVPIGGGAMALTAEATGFGRAVKGAFLFLEVIHPKPDEIEVKLTSPARKTLVTRLPAGQSNFIGVIGHTLAPSLLKELDGGPIDGTWQLELADTGTEGGGNLLEAALMFPKEDCVPGCAADDCGDDRCGGRCQVCFIDEECIADGTLQPGTICHACKVAEPSSWSATTGEPCDDHDVCTRTDACLDGVCTGTDPIVCTEGDACHVPGSCNPGSGACAVVRVDDGTSCDDGNKCTRADACKLGACRGTALTCPAEECRAPGACDPASGACGRGEPLEDGTKCTKGSCKSGECKACGCGTAGGPMGAMALALVALLRRRRTR